MGRKRTLFNLYCDLKVKRIQTGREMPRRFQVVFHRALKETAVGKSQLHPEMALELANAMRDVVEKTHNILFSPVIGVGGSGRTPTEVSCIEDAVRYRRAVESGLIKDRQPIKTILDAFGGSDSMKGGVSRSAVNKWMKEPLFKSIEVTDVEKEFLVPLLKTAGIHYQRHYTKTARSK